MDKYENFIFIAGFARLQMGKPLLRGGFEWIVSGEEIETSIPRQRCIQKIFDRVSF